MALGWGAQSAPGPGIPPPGAGGPRAPLRSGRGVELLGSLSGGEPHAPPGASSARPRLTARAAELARRAHGRNRSAPAPGAHTARKEGKKRRGRAASAGDALSGRALGPGPWGGAWGLLHPRRWAALARGKSRPARFLHRASARRSPPRPRAGSESEGAPCAPKGGRPEMESVGRGSWGGARAERRLPGSRSSAPRRLRARPCAWEPGGAGGSSTKEGASRAGALRARCPASAQLRVAPPVSLTGPSWGWMSGRRHARGSPTRLAHTVVLTPIGHPRVRRFPGRQRAVTEMATPVPGRGSSWGCARQPRAPHPTPSGTRYSVCFETLVLHRPDICQHPSHWGT